MSDCSSTSPLIGDLPATDNKRYMKGHEGYKRWYGEPGTGQQNALKPTTDETKPENADKNASTDRYLKGHVGYSRWYGNPGAPK